MDSKENILETIGKTPLVRLHKLFPEHSVYAKVEFFNPGGSVKDRMAKYIIEDAEKSGLLKPGGTIIESSSGNTGIGLSMVASVKGYKCIVTMPDKMSKEKADMMRAYGTEVIITPTEVEPEDPRSYYSVAAKLLKETPNSYSPDQYNNQKNIEAHYNTTGREVWEQTNGNVDVFIAGVGTGGTMSGTGKFLKEKKPEVKNIAVDPVGSVFHEFFRTKKIGSSSAYKLEGIGEDKIGGAIDFSVIDDMIQVNDKDAFNMARTAARTEALFIGGSSGAALWATEQAIKEIDPQRVVVVILPDSGNRYLSKMYDNQWMKDNTFI